MRRTDNSDQVPEDVAAIVLADFQRYVKRGGAVDLTDELGLAVPSGGEPWHAALRRERRDLRIGDVGEAICPGSMSAKDMADGARREIMRYRATWNRRDQFRDEPGSTHQLDKLLFEAFSLGGGDVPDSPKHLRRIMCAAIARRAIAKPLVEMANSGL